MVVYKLREDGAFIWRMMMPCERQVLSYAVRESMRCMPQRNKHEVEDVEESFR